MKNSRFVWFDDRNVNAFKGNKLLPSISIACAASCDFRCPHCIYNAPFHKETKGMSADYKKALLREAVEMGCRFLQVCHEGEPTFDPTILPLLREAHRLGMRTFMFTHGALISPEVASELHAMEICLGVKCDSLDDRTFNRMIGVPRAKGIYQGIQNLLEAGYKVPFERDGKLFTRLSLVCTVSEINVDSVKGVAQFCWDNNIFFNVARLEKGGRANRVWERIRVKDPEKLRDIIQWCSEQTGIDYRYAQPDCYCIGACGVQINHNGDSWITREGCGCDLTEPDGITYPETIVIGNVQGVGLQEIVRRVWEYRRSVVGKLDARLREYIDNLDSDSNILSACGGSRTHMLFQAYKDYITQVLSNSNDHAEHNSRQGDNPSKGQHAVNELECE